MSAVGLTGGRWVQRGAIKRWVRNPPPPILLVPIEAVPDHLHATSVDIIEAAARYFDVNPLDVLAAGCGRGELGDARHVSRWLLRETGLSYPTIGEMIRRDHSTVINSVQRVDRSAELLHVARGLRARLDRRVLEVTAA